MTTGRINQVTAHTTGEGPPLRPDTRRHYFGNGSRRPACRTPERLREHAAGGEGTTRRSDRSVSLEVSLPRVGRSSQRSRRSTAACDNRLPPRPLRAARAARGQRPQTTLHGRHLPRRVGPGSNVQSIQKLPEDLGQRHGTRRVPRSPLRAKAGRRDDATAPTMATGNPTSLAKAVTVEHTGKRCHVCRQAADTTHDRGTEAEHGGVFGALHCHPSPKVVYTSQTVTVSLALGCHPPPTACADGW